MDLKVLYQLLQKKITLPFLYTNHLTNRSITIYKKEWQGEKLHKLYIMLSIAMAQSTPGVRGCLLI